MPQVNRRRWANASTISILLILSWVLPSVAAEYRNDDAHAPVQNLLPSPTGNFQDANVPTEFMIIERQLPGIVITLPLPLSTPMPLSTNPNPLLNGTPIPLLISPYVPPSSSLSASLSRSSSSGPFVSSKSSTSAQTSQSGNSSAAAGNANGSNRLTAINFLPFIILTSFFIISLMGWCLHGWCTRRPKENFVALGTKESRKKRGGWFWNRKGKWGEESDELVCGPAYVSFVGQDVEEFATVRQPRRYRWPPLSVTTQGQGHLSQNNHDDEGPLLSESIPFEFTGLPIQTVRSVPSAEVPRAPKIGKRPMSPTTTTGPMSPTSIALKELYDVVLRNEDDSPNTGTAEERTTLLGVGSGVESADRGTRKRKGHVRQGSESRDGATQLMDLGGRWRGGILSDDGSDTLLRKKLEVRNPSEGEGRLQEGVGLVSDGAADEEDYTPLPTPTRVVHQFSFGDPPSPRGRKARGKALQNPLNLHLPLSRDILPAHPKQIMSPPLENQFYFGPMPTEEKDVDVSNKRNDGPVVGLASSPARVRGGVRPKSTVTTSREKFGERNHGVQKNPSEVVDDRPSYRGPATTSPLRTAPGNVKDEHRDSSSHRNGANKGKGKLVKASPAARSHVKRQAGED